MSPGTVLVLYTDGLVEGRDRSLDDGFDQLAEHLSGLDTRNLTQLLDDICVAMDVGDTHDDDIALLAIRLPNRPGPNAPRTE